MVTGTPAASTLRRRGRVAVQARDLLATPQPRQSPYMSRRESTRALREPAAATFLDVTVMNPHNQAPADSL